MRIALLGLLLQVACSGSVAGSGADMSGLDGGATDAGFTPAMQKVSVNSSVLGANSAVSAALYNAPGCTIETVGPCQKLTNCFSQSQAVFQGEINVTVNGASYAAPTSGSNFINKAIFSGGESVQVTASGDLFNFTSSITAPSFVTLSSPTRAALVNPTFHRGNDVEFVWQNGHAGKTLRISLASVPQTWQCEFDEALGHATIPAAVIAAAWDANITSIGVYSVSAKDFVSGDWGVSLRVVNQALTPGGDVFSGTYDFQ